MNPSGSSIPIPPASSSTGGGAPQFGQYSDWAAGEMAKGFSPAQLQQELQKNGINIQPQASAATATPASATHGGSWWQKLLPTAGGVVGGLVGSLAGGVGGIGGAAGGAALGQALENKLEGKGVIQKNLATSALENGLGEAVGLGASKVVGALGSGIVKAGARATAKTAEEARVAADVGKTVSDAEATKLNFGGISPKLASDLELGKGQQFVKGMGLDHTNPYDMEKLSSGVSEFNNVYDRALSTAKPVQMGDFNTTIFKALKANGNTDLSTTPVGQALADFNKTVGLEPNAPIPTEMSPVQVRKLQQAVGRQIGNTQTLINNAELNGVYNAEAQSNLSTLQDLYKQLGGKLKTPEVNTSIAGFQVTDADRQGLIAKYGEKMGNHIADTIGNAKSADDLLGPMQDLTKMSRASRMAINDIENVTNSPRALARAKFESSGGVMPSAASSTGAGVADLVDAAAGAVRHPAATIVKAGVKAHQAGLTPKIANGVGNVLMRTAPLIPPVAVLNSNIPNLAAPSGSAVPSNENGGAMQPATASAPAAANPVNSVLENVLFSLSQPGASLTPGYGNMVSAAAGLAPTAQQNTLAANSVAALEPTMANAGGPQGLGGGLLNMLLAHVPGTAANTYQMQQQAAAAQLAKVMGISPEQALALFPQLAQTQQVAAPQQALTGGLVNSLTAGLPAAQ